MLKDLNLAAELAIGSGAPMPFGQLARSMLQATLNEYGEDSNIDDIKKLVASQTGISFPG
ncbi:hypothetical protein [Mangrovicoccus ximenensis]|uniref:hypothetical protein n=1 Tax=Mangrovicoccus ximenensis TaxID=1911570 RepID=UPI0038B2F7A3